MIIKKSVFLLLVFLGFQIPAFSQLNIEFPSERAVFQRDNSNNGFIPVYGIGPVNADVIEGRLTPFVNGQGTATDWQVIDTNLLNGAYSGKISGKGGWYTVEVRAKVNGVVVSNYAVNKVGIGEVFIVAGQSNAQGFLSFNPPTGASDDRVNGYGYYNSVSIPENPSLTNILPLYRELNLGPHGQSSWAWGILGDLLVAKLNVPVLFFNAAYEGTTIENWVSSSKGLPTTNAGLGTPYTNQTPYSPLRIILQNHGSVYGLRSILWMQGENDFDTSQSDYRRDLNFLVNKVSQDVGKNVNWMVARTSYIFDRVYGQIISAQDQVIADNNNVFSGPFTDRIQNPRTDGVHLSYDGITELAHAFNRDLTTSVLNSMVPSLGAEIEPLTYGCVSGSLVKVSPIKNNFKEFVWSTGSTTSSAQIFSGTVSGVLRDQNGNYHLTEKLSVNGLLPPAPKVLAENDGIACIGKSARFYINSTANNVEWADGSSGYNFYTSTTEAVYAVQIDQYGCRSERSSALRASFTPTPQPPVITSLFNSYGACEGDLITLIAKSDNKRFRWSTGETSQQIIIGGVGEREYQALTITDNGCESDFSEPVAIKIFSKPVPPTIIKSGPYSIGVLNEETYEGYEWSYEGQKLDLYSGAEILASQNGFYTVKGLEVHEQPYVASCLSNASGLFLFERKENDTGIVAYPNPVVDKTFFVASDVPLSAVLSLKDIKGRTIIPPFVVKDLELPRALKMSSTLPAGTYILTVDYDGLGKRFKLFFE